jgi:hypothetical protein
MARAGPPPAKPASYARDVPSPVHPADPRDLERFCRVATGARHRADGAAVRNAHAPRSGIVIPMFARARVLTTLAALSLGACSRTPPSGGGSSPEPRGEADAAPGPTGARGPTTSPAAGPALPEGAAPCDVAAASAVTCYRFASAADALGWVLAFEPTILAVGEAHAQKGTEQIASSTRRFTEDLLPLLAPRASDVVVELWAPDPKCQAEVKKVEKAQKPVTTAQAATNPNEYVVLGTRAKEQGIVPWLLRPTCEDFALLADAGDGAVEAMLGLVKRLTAAKVTQLHEKNRADRENKIVVAYGGAMHNDIEPSEAMADFSFAAELSRLPSARYVELDLIVPEYVKSTAAWEKLPWYAAYRADTLPEGRATLYRTGDRSFTILFPASP